MMQRMPSVPSSSANSSKSFESSVRSPLRQRRRSIQEITEYSPFFHVGHEGEVVEAWANVEDPEYLAAMRRIVAMRLPARLASALQHSGDLVDAVSLASFGLPRAFLNMISRITLGADAIASPRVTWSTARDAIRENADATRSIFSALARKLPRYRRFIEMGTEIRG